MNYACEYCGFLFFRSGEASECPTCESTNIRCATEEEIKKLRDYRKTQNPYIETIVEKS